MAAGDQRMIAHMGVRAERRLHPAAHVAVVAIADFHHFVAEDGVGNPGDHPLEQVVIIELASEPAGTLWLWPIADFDVEAHDFDRAVPPRVIPVGYRRIWRLQASLD